MTGTDRSTQAAPAAPTSTPAAPTPAPAGPEGRPPQPASDTGVPGSVYGMLADGSFVVKLGSGLRLSAEDLAARGVDLTDRPQPLPGVVLRNARYRNGSLSITGDLAIPHVAAGEITVSVNAEGEARMRGRLRRTLEIPALGSPNLQVSLDETGAVAGSVEFEQMNLAPRRLAGLEATGSGRLDVTGGRISGGGSADLRYGNLGSAQVNFRFTETGVFAADGTVQVTPPFLDRISATLAVDEEQNLTAETTLDVAAQSSPLPGLTLAGGSLTLGYANGTPSASITDLVADYSGFASVSVAALALDRSSRFSGNGAFTVNVPMLDPVEGQLRVQRGVVSGQLRISASAFPEGLPVRDGTIIVRLSGDGQVSFSGTVGVELGPAGTGNLAASYDAGNFAMGAEVDLTVPGLQTVHVSVAYANGGISGQVNVPVDSELLPGLDGEVVVRFQEGRWSGETTLDYSADNGKLSGTVTVTVAQTEEGALELGGTGSVTAELMPRLSGTLTATILPEGGVDVSGAIEVTEPLELFPEERVDKELFRHSQNIPLWAILVAVIRIRAGVRAGIGPGVFRDIRVEGSYTLGAEETDPSFSVTGELFIPAFVEGYVAFGAGLGLDVVLGSLTGGIEAVGTAGLYGAISVVPELHYEDGDWGIEGTATLAAGARLKLGLNAWAEVEALWVTVWENEWQLAEHVMPIGPDLALRAHMNYKFGQPEPPEIEVSSTDIDAEALITSAMPEDGPAPSGAREALENRAEWQGALREQRAAPVPSELAAQAQETEAPPQPPPKPPDNTPAPPAGGAQVGGPGPNQDPGTAPTSANEQARSQAVDAAAAPDHSVEGTVPPSEVPTSDTPRYPGPITLAMLDEPPAPMPRTRAQEGADVDAARQAVLLAESAATDSDALDNYFPRIKHRFGLSSLGYEGDFQRGFRVVGKINPEFTVEATEILTGTGIPGDLQPGHITNVEFGTSTLEGDQVGIRMKAEPLGPDHPQGSGPSGQVNLMGMLPTDPGTYPEADQRYIRGHLLNDNVGGPGRPHNLFPITAHANAVHHSQIEDAVKTWVNDRRYWVTYTVEVRAEDTLQTTSSGINFVNSTLTARASVLNTKLDPVPGLTRAVTVSSTFDTRATATVQEEEDAAALEGHQARAVDQSVDVLLSTTKGDTTITFPAVMETTMKERIAARGRPWVAGRLRSQVGFGERSEAVLFKAYDEIKRRTDKTVNGLDPDEVPVFTRIRNAWASDLAPKLV